VERKKRAKFWQLDDSNVKTSIKKNITEQMQCWGKVVLKGAVVCRQKKRGKKLGEGEGREKLGEIL